MGASALGSEVRRRLGPAPELESWPLVSIVVVNRDGAAHLRRLLAGLEEHTDYPHFELILVDNASSDESLQLVRAAAVRFPVSIVANPHNESFSDACNQGAELASGPLLLFLNNDIEPFEDGWLRELVGCLRARQAGLVGATLIQPNDRAAHGYSVQHRAIRLQDDSGLLRAELFGRGEEPLDLADDADSPVAAGACMLVERDGFEAIGGFTHGFFYGGEDIDLGFKMLSQGRRVVCSGRSLLVHRLGSTRKKERDEQQHLAVGSGNRRLLWERWGPRVRREYELDRLEANGFWASPDSASATQPPTREEVLALGFCLKAGEPDPSPAVEESLSRLRSELVRRGHRCVLLRGEHVDDLVGFNHDVAVHVRGALRYVPKPAQLNVLWTFGHPDALTPIERGRYQLVVDAQDPVETLIDAALARARALGFPTRLQT